MRFSLAVLFLILAPLYLFPEGSGDAFEEANIRESAFRHFMKQDSYSSTYCFSSGLNSKGMYEDPSSLFMKRFEGDARVKKASDCIEDNARPILTDKQAVLLTPGELKYVNRNQATLRVQYFRDVRDSGAGIYTLEKSKDGAWKVTDFKSMTISKVGK